MPMLKTFLFQPKSRLLRSNPNQICFAPTSTIWCIGGDFRSRTCSRWTQPIKSRSTGPPWTGTSSTTPARSSYFAAKKKTLPIWSAKRFFLSDSRNLEESPSIRTRGSCSSQFGEPTSLNWKEQIWMERSDTFWSTRKLSIPTESQSIFRTSNSKLII